MILGALLTGGGLMMVYYGLTGTNPFTKFFHLNVSGQGITTTDQSTTPKPKSQPTIRPGRRG